MNEQLIRLLENLNVGIESLAGRMADMLNVSVEFIESNFEVAFYSAGRYMFWDKMLSDLLFMIFISLCISGLIAMLYVLIREEILYLDSKMKHIAGIMLVTTPVILLLIKIKDIILYNVAKEIWIAEHLLEYMNYFK